MKLNPQQNKKFVEPLSRQIKKLEVEKAQTEQAKKMYSNLKKNLGELSEETFVKAFKDYKEARKVGMGNKGKMIIVEADSHGNNNMYKVDMQGKGNVIKRQTSVSLGDGLPAEAKRAPNQKGKDTKLSNEPGSYYTPQGSFFIRGKYGGERIREGYQLDDVAGGNTFERKIVIHIEDIGEGSAGCIRMSAEDYVAYKFEIGDLVSIYKKEK